MSSQNCFTMYLSPHVNILSSYIRTKYVGGAECLPCSYRQKSARIICNLCDQINQES